MANDRKVFFQDLNAQQLSAVEHTQGPLIVLAGPGTGKTRVLVYHVYHLIERCGVAPYQIMALTFTNKAAREMQTRLTKLLDGQQPPRWVGTFHSLFARILRKEAPQIGFSSNFSIYDREDSQQLIKLINKELQLDEESYKPGMVLHRIGQAKNNFLDAASYASSLYAEEDQEVGKAENSV